MKEMDILEMIGEARADYILDAQSFQKGEHNMRKVSGKKVWLIGAMVVLAMTLMGCTVAYAYAQGWFTSLYSAQNEVLQTSHPESEPDSEPAHFHPDS